MDWHYLDIDRKNIQKNARTHAHTHTHTHIYIYILICQYITMVIEDRIMIFCFMSIEMVI